MRLTGHQGAIVGRQDTPHTERIFDRSRSAVVTDDGPEVVSSSQAFTRRDR